MNGFRKPLKNETMELEEINQMIRDYHKHNPVNAGRKLNKKIRAWLMAHGNPKARNMSGFKAFVIENTKIEA
jgi:hypothetical protein